MQNRREITLESDISIDSTDRRHRKQPNWVDQVSAGASSRVTARQVHLSDRTRSKVHTARWRIFKCVVRPEGCDDWRTWVEAVDGEYLWDCQWDVEARDWRLWDSRQASYRRRLQHGRLLGHAHRIPSKSEPGRSVRLISIPQQQLDCLWVSRCK